MRKNLKERRKSFGYKTQKEFAEALNISLRTYQNIEQGKTFPREKLMKKIMKLLNTKSFEIFHNSNSNYKRGEITKNILELMNSQSTKTFTEFQVNAIKYAILLELNDRKKKGFTLKINSNGKRERLKRIAKIANDEYSVKVAIEDIKLFKLCRIEEYEKRTGKCTWSIPEVREKLGYDPITGQALEVMEEDIDVG